MVHHQYFLVLDAAQRGVHLHPPYPPGSATESHKNLQVCSILLPHAHAQGGQVIGCVVVVSTKIAISRDVGDVGV